MSKLLGLAVVLALTACRGTVPERNAPPEQAISAILIGSRFILPSGETKKGFVAVNLETEGGDRAEVYRIPVRDGQNFLYLVEPGTYRLMPTRSIFGFTQDELKVVIEGRTYRVPFPREILRLPAYNIKPKKIITFGVLEAKVMPALPGRKPEMKVRLDDSVAARRKVVQDMIREMMDPARPLDARESAISWSRAIQNSLLDILSEEDKKPMYKPAE